ncbi:MAG: YceI family protein [Acidimicrobiales bacterium]
MAVPLVGLVAVIGGSRLYTEVLRPEAPERLQLSEGDTADAVPLDPSAIEGTWAVGAGSEAGYRVAEVLFGADTEGAGRTTQVSGEVTFAGGQVTAADIAVDLASVTSDEERRDNQFRGRIMNTAEFPTATFRLTEPVSLPTAARATVAAPGEFTIRGTTKRLEASLAARQSGQRIEVSGTVPVTFADFGIPDPSFGPARVQPNGEIEFLLFLDRP